MNKEKGLLKGVLFVSAFSLLHTYLLYPLALAIVARLIGTRQRELPSELPTVSLIIAAYNEEEIIAEKIENSLMLEYPSEKLNIVVFSDASSDKTDEIVESFPQEQIRLIRVEGRVGKTECQNIVAEQVEGEVLVFSDANSMYEPNAIKELVRGFEPDVGCVVGELRYGESGVEGESAYWRYERLIKRFESTLGSTVTGNGSIYAVRSSVYTPLPRDAISDFAEPLALIENGHRVAYAPTAVAREHTGSSVDSELSRRVRITTRSWNTLANHRGLLNPLRYPLFAFKLLSHKVLRWLSPVFLVVVLASSVALAVLITGPLYLVFVGLQSVFYLCAFTGAIGDRLGCRVPIIFHIPYYFVISNYGMGRGLVNFLYGRNLITWETADRSLREETRE